ncbi:MAG: methylamine utilization protein MauE [Gammaproteobacteria bacterium]|nr:methylamine utilization protein MauE [Gammaproteobacteria bacterium]
MIDPVLSLACALVLAWIFIAAGAHKFHDPARFGAALGAYGLLPEVLVRPAALLLPLGEFMIAFGLLFPQARSIAAWSSVLLIGAYTLAIGINLLRGRRNIDCGCGDPGRRQPLSEWLLLRNALLMGAGALAAAAPFARVAGWLDWTVAALAAIALGLIHGACNQLLSNRHRLANLGSTHG